MHKTKNKIIRFEINQKYINLKEKYVPFLYVYISLIINWIYSYRVSEEKWNKFKFLLEYSKVW